MIKVLVVDDSALMREMLKTLLSRDPDLDVVGSAPDPFIARDMIKKLNPDVLTLDVEMPRMDGLSFLRKIMALRPMPVVMVSSLTVAGGELTVEALAAGAVDFVTKPDHDLKEGMEAKVEELSAKIKAASKARLRARQPGKEPARPIAPLKHSTEKIIAIGASTGGVEAISDVLGRMPADSPAMVVVQHMPPRFTASFADRLDNQCAMRVVEASDGQRILRGHAYIAPGSHHLRVVRDGANYVCRLSLEDPVSGHRPSVDVVFQSMAETVGKNGVGLILTGMGRDGARGMLAMRQAGARTLGQDEATSLIYGMPMAAQEVGAVERQIPLERAAQAVLDLCREQGGKAIRI